MKYLWKSFVYVLTGLLVVELEIGFLFGWFFWWNWA
jgi:hypothetical protein